MPQSAPQSTFISKVLTFKGMVKALPIMIWIVAAVLQPAALYAQNSDSSGVQILEQAIAASGGRTAWDSVRDFRATGTMSLLSSGNVTQSGRAELVGKGLQEFKLAANVGDHSRIWLWNKGLGRLDTGNSKPSPIGRHNLTALEAFNLPLLKIIALCDGPSRSVTLVGVKSIEGLSAYRVRITRRAMNQGDQVALGRASFQLDVLIDQKSFVVLATEDTLYPNNQPQDAFAHRIDYSDYRTVAGVQIPFKMTERISGQVTWNLQLDSYLTNSGVSESEFIPY